MTGDQRKSFTGPSVFLHQSTREKGWWISAVSSLWFFWSRMSLGLAKSSSSHYPVPQQKE